MEQDYYKVMAGLQKRHWWYEGRRRIIAHLIGRLDLPKENASLLEVGCGTGANIEMLKSFGELSAIEPNDYAVEQVKNIGGVRIESGLLPDKLPFEGEGFDLIGAFDVIEHVNEDAASLKALYDRTRAGGYAVFTVPAFQFLWSHHDEINHHKRRYRKHEFKKLLQDAGYEIKLISYYNFWLFPLAAAVRSLKKLLGKEDQGDVKMPGSDLVNSMLCGIFASERFVLPVLPLPFGLSIIAVCQKKTGES